MPGRRTLLPASPPQSPSSVSVGFVNGILSGLEYDSPRRHRVLEHAELAKLDLTAADHKQRIPAARYAALYRSVVSELQDEAFGLFSRPLRPGCFEWLVRAALATETLEDALQRLVAGLNLLQDNLRLEWLATAPAAEGARRLQIEVIQPVRAGPAGFVFVHEWLLRLLQGIGAWLVTHPLTLDAVAFPYPPPPHAGDYPRLFAPRVEFNHDHLIAYFPGEVMSLRVQRDEAALRQWLQTAPAAITFMYRDERALGPRVRALLRAALPEFLPLEECARRLGLSARSLHRQLQAESTSYRQLRESLRHALACEALTKTSRSVAQIALDLGYADSTALYRAFVAWEGCGPRQWRARRGLMT
jgi:AraC-like DNA-binding protein